MYQDQKDFKNKNENKIHDFVLNEIVVFTMKPSEATVLLQLRDYVGTVRRICLFSNDFHSDSTLILITIAMK
jgi:hypothetical protein